MAKFVFTYYRIVYLFFIFRFRREWFSVPASLQKQQRKRKPQSTFPFDTPASSDEVFSLFAGAESETLFYETF